MIRAAASTQPLCGYKMTIEEARSNDEPLASLVGCAKVLLALTSVSGVLGWIYVVFITLVWFGVPRTLFSALGLIYPFVYLAAAIYCCWTNIPLRTLYMTAVILNLPLAIFSIYWKVEGGAFPSMIIIFLLFIALWALLCLARTYGHKPPHNKSLDASGGSVFRN